MISTNITSTSIITATVIGVLSLLQISCNSEGQSKDNTSKDSTVAIPVETARVEQGDIAAYYMNTATLEAETEAQVVSRVRGIVRQIYVEEGDRVKEGQVLVQLEDEQLEIEVQRTRADMDKLMNEFERNKKLYEKQLISAEQFENSRFEYESQKAAYELAELNLRNTKIKAPIEGVVAERLIKRGNTVDQNGAVFRIADFDPLLAVLHVPEHEMSKISRNQVALIHADARPGKQFEGYVQRVSPVVNAETGTFKVTVAVEDATQQLRPGMFARIRIIYDKHQNTLLIPKQALIIEDTEQHVYVIENRVAYKRTVQTGYFNHTHTEITEGLRTGDEVVIVGQTSLQDSALVDIINY